LETYVVTSKAILGATLSCLGISAVRYERHVGGLKQIQCYFSDMDSNKKKNKGPKRWKEK